MPHWAKPSPAAGVQIFPLAILTYDRAKRQKLLAGPDWDAFRRALSGCCVCVFLKVHLVSKAGAANAVLVLMQELLAVHYSADRAAHRAVQHVLAQGLRVLADLRPSIMGTGLRLNQFHFSFLFIAQSRGRWIGD